MPTKISAGVGNHIIIFHYFYNYLLSVKLLFSDAFVHVFFIPSLYIFDELGACPTISWLIVH